MVSLLTRSSQSALGGCSRPQRQAIEGHIQIEHHLGGLVELTAFALALIEVLD